MSILSISGLSHIFDSKVLFDNASVNINNGEHIGVVGLNGAGKSTFMNIITGKLSQDEGEIKWLNGIRWGYLDQHANIDRNITVMDYLKTAFTELYELNERMEKLYEKMGEDISSEEMELLIEKTGKMMDTLTKANFYEIEAEIKKVANGLGVNNFGYDTKIGNLSGGQRAKLMLAKLLLQKLDVMLLDEPTNFLDIEHIDWLSKFLDNFKGTFLCISHDTQFLNSVSKFILSVENYMLKKYTGNYNQFLVQRECIQKQYEESYERQQREIKKMEEYIAKNKARAATAGMANSRKKMLEKIDVLNKPVKALPATFNFPHVELITKEMLVLENLSVGYKKPLLPPISITIKNDTKLWIRGTNGIGKSTLLKTVMSVIPKLEGRVKFHVHSKIGYLEQDLTFGNDLGNAVGYMNETFPRMNQKDIRTELSKVGIKNELATKPINELSGGEQVRIRLCALMQKMTNILILDEPTNHLDVLAKEELKRALKEYKGAIILVSHESDFASEICDEVFDAK